MTKQVTFVSATSYSLDVLGDIFTRAFENYFYPGTTTAAILSGRVRTEQIDLERDDLISVGAAMRGQRRLVAIDHDHARAGCQHRQRAREADARCRARDDRHFPVQ